MKYSFQLYSARNFTPWEQVLKSIAGLGYSQVEGFGALYEAPQATRDLLDANGLTMPSGHFSLDAIEDDMPALFSMATTLGCKDIYCPHLAADLRPDDAAGWQAFGKRLNELGKRIADKGFKFGWHNHDFEFIACEDGSMPMRSILESAPDINWEMDVAWTVRAGVDPSPWIKEFASRITAVHVKDIAAPGENPDEDGWADVGHGTMDWKSLMNEISAQTKANLFVAEHDNPSDNERFASRSIQSLKSYV